MRLMIFALAALFSTTAMADNWMADVADATLLCRMSIPGTHDSATGNGMASGMTTSFAVTQDKTLDAQWECGIRAFDLRPALKSGKLTIYHGTAQTKLSFDEALAIICGKLADNPSECAIVVMQNEGGGDDNEWGCHVTASLDKVKDYLVDYKPGLTLGEMRGRLLVLNRNLYRPIPYGGVCQGWGNNAQNNQGTIEAPNGTKGYFHVQDFYEVKANGASEQKKQYIENMLEASAKANNKHLYINHTSGYTNKGNLFGVPTVTGMRDNAASANTHLLELLADAEHETWCTGLVMMDYAGVDSSGSVTVNGARLVEAVIATNVVNADPVGMDSPASNAAPSVVYDLSGRRVPSADVPRLTIDNGRKVAR